MMKAELVFMPLAAAGHIVSTVELAKLLVDRDERLYVTVLIVKVPVLKPSDYSTSVPSGRIKFIELPSHALDSSLDPGKALLSAIEKAKPQVKEVVSKLASHSQSSDDSPKLAGFVLDMMLTTMIDVADEFGVPSYIFFASSAAFLGLLFHLQDIHDERGVDPSEFNRTDDELALPTFVHPLPTKVLPTLVFTWVQGMIDMTRKFRKTKGIIINTFSELEPHALNALYAGTIPPVYAVGPILNLKRESHDEGNNNFAEIMQWLDDQPPSSVVFLCFGSMGNFPADQVKEIAHALENTGCRFLWSLLKCAPKDKIELPADYSDPQDVLPDGFLDRTSDVGRVIRWAPQVHVLAHSSIGGFVSHCGWNSILESVWYGVPIAAWPLYSEQQLNAFEIVVELRLAVEIKMDYRSDLFNPIFEVITVTNEELERGIRCLMNNTNERIKLVKEMRENSKNALAEGGSSYMSMGRLIQDIINSIQ